MSWAYTRVGLYVAVYVIYKNFGFVQVMEAASLSQDAWEKHRIASIEFEEKQRIVKDLYQSLHKHINKSRYEVFF